MKGLTKPRRSFLEQLIREGGSGTGADYYPPIKWLADNGLIEKREGRYTHYWHVTDAGRAAVAVGSKAPDGASPSHISQDGGHGR